MQPGITSRVVLFQTRVYRALVSGPAPTSLSTARTGAAPTTGSRTRRRTSHHWLGVITRTPAATAATSDNASAPGVLRTRSTAVATESTTIGMAPAPE